MDKKTCTVVLRYTFELQERKITVEDRNVGINCEMGFSSQNFTALEEHSKEKKDDPKEN